MYMMEKKPTKKTKKTPREDVLFSQIRTKQNASSMMPPDYITIPCGSTHRHVGNTGHRLFYKYRKYPKHS